MVVTDPPAFCTASIAAADAPETVARIHEGYDIVYGERKTRQESFYLRALYSGFYRLCRFLSDVDMPVDAGDFCVMTRDVILALRALPEKLRFQRGLRSWIGDAK